MKSKKSLKRITAVVLCVIMLATSFPIAFAANGTYNPAPYFTEDAQQKGAAAWVDDEGDLQIRFPAATGRPTHAVWSGNHDETENVKAIDRYIIELSDLGGKLEKHNTTPPVLLSKTFTAAEVSTGTGKLSAVLTAAELGDSLDLVNKRYNIAITAVDEAGWRSIQLHALVFDVPEFYFDMSNFEVLSENEHAMRELMRFESAGSYTGYEQTGDSVQSALRTNGTGADNQSTDTKSYGYRIHVSSQPGANGQTIDTGESRQTWNFRGAEEVWFWLDLSDVELQGLSFRLRANYKRIDYSITDGKIDGSTTQHYGNIVYSTLGTKNNTYAEDQKPYILIQDENGNWEKMMLTNGTVNLGHFKGYVRIPIQFMCSETPSTIQTNSSAVFGQKQSYNQSNLNTFYENNVCLGKPNSDSYSTGVFPTNVQIDPAGTPISEALLIQQGKIKASRVFATTLNYQLGNFLAPGLGDSEINATTANNPKRAYVEKDGSGNWVVQNRANGYKALDDVYSAGVAYQSVSEDSLNNSFFLDNIMFYRASPNEDGSEFTWEHAQLDGNMADGTKVATYFDQGVDAQDRILDAIDQYIGSPTWTDYRGVKYVNDMIATFYETYKQAKGEAYADSILTLDALAARATATERTDTWNNYTKAAKLCGDANLLDGNNARPNDLVPMLVQSLEKLPDPSTVTTISDALSDEVIKLFQAYTRLNYGQLKMFGSYIAKDADGNATALYEEEKILKYAELLLDQLEGNTVTGYKLAKNPFIPFNDFEQNTELGDRAWRLEDDTNYITGNTAVDYSHTKNFATLATNNFNDMGIGQCENSRTIDHVYSGIDVNAHAADSLITANGYKNSKGYTTTINSSALQVQSGNVKGTFYLSRINKNSVNTATNFDQFKANNMSAENLGGLQMSNTDNQDALQGDTYLSFALAMYVDFTDMTDENGAGDFMLGFKIHTLDSNGNTITYFPGMGSSVGGQDWWRTYYVMNQTTGEWERVYFNANGFASGIRYFPSKSIRNDGSGNAVSLAGYKGYIAIPMVHFKRGGSENEYLMNTPAALNNIFSVEVLFAAQYENIKGEKVNPEEFAGKTFTIDNIGFTYDPDYYALKGKDLSGRNDKSYAEVFNAKSTKATEFETAVADIDPYDTATLADKIKIAEDIYDTLPQWPKDNIQTVKQAKALLDQYSRGDIPQAAMTVDELRAKIAALPNVPDNAVTEKPLPSPGFVPNASDPRVAGTVNYAAFEFESKAQAEEIITYYTDTYRRLSAADKALLTDAEKTKFLNAYNAAMRCTDTLEMIRDNAISFAEKLKNLYTRYNEGSQYLNLINASDRDSIAALSANEYDPLAYYAKVGLSDGSIIPAYANMTDGITRYLANVQTDDSGEVNGGGVYELMKQYTQLYKDVKTYLDNKEVIPDALAAKLNEAIAEYNDLIPAYKNVFELYYGSEKDDASGEYQGIKDILELFPRYSGSFENPVEGTDGKIANLDLNRDNEATESATLNIDYVEELPLPDAENGTGVNSVSYFKIKYNGTLTGGVDSRNYQLKLNGNDVPAVDITADPVLVTDEMLGGSLKNNTANSLVFTATLTDTRAFAQQLTDTVTIYHYRPAKENTDEVGEQLIDTYTLNVTYTPSEAYTVTIPAEFPIDWGNTDEVDVSYTVTCVLGTGKKLDVYVVGKDGFLTAEEDTAYTMNYTATGFGVGAKSTFQGVHTNAKPTTTPTVQISDTTWQDSPVGKYKDTLTYTVEYTTS